MKADEAEREKRIRAERNGVGTSKEEEAMNGRERSKRKEFTAEEERKVGQQATENAESDAQGESENQRMPQEGG